MGCWAILGVAIGPIGGIRKLRRAMTSSDKHLERRSREEIRGFEREKRKRRVEDVFSRLRQDLLPRFEK